MSEVLKRQQRRQYELKKRKTVKRMEKLYKKAISQKGDETLPTSDQIGLSSMSDIIHKHVSILCNDGGNVQTIDLICNCWNIGAFPEESADRLWEVLVDPVLRRDFDDSEGLLKEYLKEIVNQRRIDYCEDPRFIIGFNLKNIGQNEKFINIKSAIISHEELLNLIIQKSASFH